jgi:histidinol-phosphate/aromatic aminotransferase/cobyric acid decarboxylase-like protein
MPLCENSVRVTVPPKPIAETFIKALGEILER